MWCCFQVDENRREIPGTIINVLEGLFPALSIREWEIDSYKNNSWIYEVNVESSKFVGTNFRGIPKLYSFVWFHIFGFSAVMYIFFLFWWGFQFVSKSIQKILENWTPWNVMILQNYCSWNLLLNKIYASNVCLCLSYQDPSIPPFFLREFLRFLHVFYTFMKVCDGQLFSLFICMERVDSANSSRDNEPPILKSGIAVWNFEVRPLPCSSILWHGTVLSVKVKIQYSDTRRLVTWTT